MFFMCILQRLENLRWCFQFGPTLKEKGTNPKRFNLNCLWLVIWFGLFEDVAKLKIPSEIFPSLLRSGEGEESHRAVPTLLLIL